MTTLNRTHDASVRSWVASANEADTDFPIQNLPFGVFRRRSTGDAPRCGVAIGDQIVDISRAPRAFEGPAADAARACGEETLNTLMALPATAVSDLRAQLFALLAQDATAGRQLEPVLVPMAEAELLLPVRISGYTDFFASVHHATNAGRLFRPDQPLLPNYKYVPVGYNGRAASVQLDSASVHRPRGQLRRPDGETPIYQPCEKLDYEVELGMLIGRGSARQTPVSVDAAWQHLFGFCLLNDWSARDLQAWEAQPLGPFLAKSFATSVSAWVVTAEALAPFRVAPATRAAGDPAPLPHLTGHSDASEGAVRIVMDAHLRSQRMRETGVPAVRLSRSDSATLYWTPAQMLAHHTSNGSFLQNGDLLGSGTISGADASAMGSLLEITRGGAQPLELGTGEQRRFLEDGDEVVLTGFCERVGFARIGFGECRSIVLPTPSQF